MSPQAAGLTPDVKYQMHASATMTQTTTRLMTVSWNIACGKNAFPSCFVRSLYRSNDCAFVRWRRESGRLL